MTQERELADKDVKIGIINILNTFKKVEKSMHVMKREMKLKKKKSKVQLYAVYEKHFKCEDMIEKVENYKNISQNKPGEGVPFVAQRK